jgi:hypothetical protein
VPSFWKYRIVVGVLVLAVEISQVVLRAEPDFDGRGCGQIGLRSAVLWYGFVAWRGVAWLLCCGVGRFAARHCDTDRL